MATLYLTEQGAVVRKTGERLIVEKEGQELLEIECFKLDTILVFGTVHLTTPALIALLEHGIELAFLSMSGRLRGQLTPPKAKNVLLRMAQYQKGQDPARALALARAFVRGKVENALALLTRQHRNYPERGFDAYRQELQRLLRRIEAVPTLEALRGLEGTAARTYFQGFGLGPAVRSWPSLAVAVVLLPIRSTRCFPLATSWSTPSLPACSMPWATTLTLGFVTVQVPKIRLVTPVVDAV
ncbi:MAG: hypothetical protein KatS3mg131_2238 [Candidatus Tectimicrobiota bacterium]|nr:MAG: hypothetical protein KatS3mg131_2238 [Candidatus Tectomicrobia bacterium]